jgi:hypothetical protein
MDEQVARTSWSPKFRARSTCARRSVRDVPCAAEVPYEAVFPTPPTPAVSLKFPG